MKKQLDAN
ncbi:Protein of unknown function [Bacillus mycoides]|uniref:Uncharacterized protein n=1 Tax=Bacillus mycoides TaxID=1405 RepID=A0A1D3N930_BACMY|nr:Protein of unknown function [Bacillus mycoides]SCM94579.1 Protein of unknown function [Bacillus mycoides]